MNFDFDDLKDGAMTYLGSSILKGMSSEIPILDMFVREAIQNSVDARLENVSSVREEINCGDFDFNKLIGYYPQISTKLMFTKHDNRQFISIRDYNTTGLEGYISYSEYKASHDKDIGKFLSLVRNVGKSNKIDDAGGSWGYGKTTYFRLGVGLVIYYTRIKDHINGNYLERLMTGLIENEKNSSGLLYEYQKNNHTGIAWWGKKVNDELLPITDHETIVNFLKMFNIKPYENDETGTCIIVPFINEKELLNETIPTTIEDNSIDIPHWCKSIEEYLDIACQRWYPTRYCNAKASPNIVLFINGVMKYSQSMYPVFSIYQKMYNMYLNNEESNDGIDSFKIKLNGIFNNGSFAGTLYYSFLSKEDLRMNEYGNNPSPFTQINNRKDENDSRVIIGFCRTPGMILKYDINEAWSNGIINNDPEKYLICLFIPNSSNTASVEFVDINGDKYQLKISIEDYLRASERAEHSDWTDNLEYTFPDGKKVNTSKLRIVERIQRNIRNEFSRKSKQNEDKPLVHVGTALNQKLASMFLPKKGFGKRPAVVIKPPVVDPPVKKRVSKTKFEFGSLKISNDSSFIKEFRIQLKQGDKNVELEFEISTESGPISAKDWIIDNFPVDTMSIEIDDIVSKNKIDNINHYFAFNDSYSDINFEWLTKDNKYNYGFKLNFERDDIIEITGKIHYIVVDPSISLIISKRSSGD